MATTVPKRVELRGKYGVRIHSALHSGAGWLLNLAKDGAYVTTPMHLLPQAQVRLQIVLPEERRWVEAEAVVAWENRGRARRGGLPPGYGLRFIKVPEETAAAFSRMLGGEAPAAEPASPEPADEVIVPQGPPYPLKEEAIHAVTPESAKGIFVLSYDGTQDAWVGRADENLRDSLTDFVGVYAYFYHECIDVEEERFHRECELFHSFGGDRGQLDNVAHPLPPAESNLTCPICPTQSS
jgi:hypothetical protein